MHFWNIHLMSLENCQKQNYFLFPPLWNHCALLAWAAWQYGLGNSLRKHFTNYFPWPDKYPCKVPIFASNFDPWFECRLKIPSRRTRTSETTTARRARGRGPTARSRGSTPTSSRKLFPSEIRPFKFNALLLHEYHVHRTCKYKESRCNQCGLWTFNDS